MPDYDVAIIGAGPGGYVAAIRAAQLGLRACLIERDQVGGLCLNWGCVPSKALLHAAALLDAFRRGPEFGITYEGLRADLGAAVDRSRQVVSRLVAGVETLLEQNKVRLIRGAGRLAGPGEVRVQPGGASIRASHVILAAGGRPRSLPGLAVDGERVISSRQALALRRPPASLVIVGGGATGVEMAYLFSAYGSHVTIVELMPRLLPAEDEDVSRALEQALRQRGINVRVGARVEALSTDGADVRVRLAGGEELPCERVLLVAGIEAQTEGLGLEEAGVALDERGFVAVDDYGATSVQGVWAVGDLTGRLPLAHVASQQGVTAVEKIAGRSPPPFDCQRVPRAVYCQPQVASLGLSETQARERGVQVRSGRFPLRANATALAAGESEGFIKIVSDTQTGAVIGFHAFGRDVTTLLGEVSLAAVLEATPAELAAAVYAHPTLAEAVKEAALAVSGEALHLFSSRAGVRAGGSG